MKESLKCKIFYDHDYEGLENQINDFFKKGSIRILQIRYESTEELVSCLFIFSEVSNGE